jgi:peptidoglycan/LPS O-acetylase OafA/YrhL
MREIRALTSLRGVAAMAIVLQHFSATAQEHAAVTIPSLVPHGYIAVDLFFILSGFILSYTYSGAFLSLGFRAMPDFFARRIARIAPLNIFVVIVLTIVGSLSLGLIGRNIFFSSHNLPFDFFANILMLQGLGVGENINGPSWSISTEFAAYVAFPILVIAAFRSRLSFFLSIAVSIIALGWIASHQPRYGLGADSGIASVLRCFSEFTIGMAAYRAFRLEWTRRFFGRDAITFGLALWCAISMVLRADVPAVAMFPALIVACASNQGRVAALLTTRVPYFLGVVSYSLYLIHSPFRPVELALVRLVHPSPLSFGCALLFAAAGSLSIIPFAWLAYEFIEKPGRRLGRSVLSVRSTGSASNAAATGREQPIPER